MIAQQHSGRGFWPGMGTDFLSAVPRNIQDQQIFHKRGSSGSSVASAGPASPHQTASFHPQIADADYSPSRFELDYPSTTTTKSHFLMPEQAMFQTNAGYNTTDMKRIHSPGHDERVSYGPQSVSTSLSHHNSPATPPTWGDSYDDNGTFSSVAYQQSLQDVFPDQPIITYNGNGSNNVNKMNHRHTLQEQFSRSQQQHLRTGSPTSNPRDKSPFKSTSRFQPVLNQPVPQLKTIRSSVSPKELLLDEHDIDEPKATLFPDQASFNRQPSNFSNFYTGFNTEPSVQIPQHYPFVSQSNGIKVPQDSTPDFPAHMLSMESTNEEGPSEPSSQQSHLSVRSKQSVTRPNVSSDAGTYSCTYHGCPLRFDSPAKLQKHKREGHRQIESVGATSAAAKNTQAGPHRCDRINPSTGKPCNSIFSRPYDLTRHEDTIHNARKLKVRCHLCTEEKTFSRNDALTRHMRVVHPDVDWVGKQKKRSTK